MSENFRMIDDEDFSDMTRTLPRARAPLAQVLIARGAHRRTERTDDPFANELLVPVNAEITCQLAGGPISDFIEVEEVEVVTESARTTVRGRSFFAA